MPVENYIYIHLVNKIVFKNKSCVMCDLIHMGLLQLLKENYACYTELHCVYMIEGYH